MGDGSVVSIADVDAMIIGFMGPRGSGKTQAMVSCLVRMHSHLRGFAIASDRYRDMPEEVIDGTRARYAQLPAPWVIEARIGFRGISPLRQEIWKVDGYSQSEVLRTGMELAPRLYDSKTKKGQKSIIMIDECADWKQLDLHGCGWMLKDYIAGARHLGLFCLWGCQFPRQIHYSLPAQSNYLVCFRMTDKKDVTRLEEAALSDRAIDRIRNLREHEPLLVKKQGGDLAGFDPLPVGWQSRTYAEVKEQF